MRRLLTSTLALLLGAAHAAAAQPMLPSPAELADALCDFVAFDVTAPSDSDPDNASTCREDTRTAGAFTAADIARLICTRAPTYNGDFQTLGIMPVEATLGTDRQALAASLTLECRKKALRLQTSGAPAGSGIETPTGSLSHDLCHLVARDVEAFSAADVVNESACESDVHSLSPPSREGTEDQICNHVGLYNADALAASAYRATKLPPRRLAAASIASECHRKAVHFLEAGDR